MTRSVLYKTLHYIFTRLPSFFALWFYKRNSYKTLFFNASKILQISVQNSKYETLFSTRGNYFSTRVKILNPNTTFQPEEIATNFSYKFKTIDVILMCLEILLHKHKAVIKAPEIVKQTVNRK